MRPVPRRPRLQYRPKLARSLPRVRLALAPTLSNGPSRTNLSRTPSAACVELTLGRSESGERETSDGASILVHGLGRADSATFASGGACWFTPLFETGDARYAWLNKVQGIARGRAQGELVTFELYEAR